MQAGDCLGGPLGEWHVAHGTPQRRKHQRRARRTGQRASRPGAGAAMAAVAQAVLRAGCCIESDHGWRLEHHQVEPGHRVGCSEVNGASEEGKQDRAARMELGAGAASAALAQAVLHAGALHRV
jgi:hypothetical protein